MFRLVLLLLLGSFVLPPPNGIAFESQGPKSPIGPSTRSESAQLRIAELEQKEIEKFRTSKVSMTQRLMIIPCRKAYQRHL